MSVHETILGHLIGWGLPRRHEDAATEGLAFLLQRHAPLRGRFMGLLRAAQPGLPEELRFATQEAAGRSELAGRDGEALRVFVEGKFGAALVDPQPATQLARLAEEPAATLLLVIAPEWRRPYLWRELQERLAAAGVGHREAGREVLEVVGRAHSQRVALLSWAAVLQALGEAATDDARANLEQLAGVCRVAGGGEARPLVREELTDPQVPARLIQYVDIVRGVIGRGSEAFRAVSGKHSQLWHAVGQKIQFSGDRGPVAWFGVDFLRWRDLRSGPLWLHFDWNYGQARVVKERLQAWAGERQRALCDTEDGVMLGLELLVGRDQQAVVDDVIGQLRAIAGLLRAAPGK